MQPLIALRRDPAPSRVAYRMHRLWLTPLFRSLLRVGLPSFVVVFAVIGYLGNDTRRAAISDGIGAIWSGIQQRPEFMIGMIAIEGATLETDTAVRAALALNLPVSSFDVDMEAARQRIATLDAIERVELMVKPGGTLKVAIKERVPAVVWRGREGLELLDGQGRRVRVIASRTERADLPLIAGTGAGAAVDEALTLFAAADPIASRIRGLVRIGERRWDLVLDRNQRIYLPEDNPVRALERLIALNQAQGLLDRAITVVDMRNDNRPTLRLTPEAVGELQRIRGIEVGATAP